MTNIERLKNCLSAEMLADYLADNFDNKRFAEIVNNEICDIPLEDFGKADKEEYIDKHCKSKGGCRRCIKAWLNGDTPTIERSEKNDNN